MSLTKRLKERVWFFLHHNRRNRYVARFAMLCKNIHRATEHPTYNTMVNGERDAVMRLTKGSHPIIFDVGSNVGDWTALTLDLFPTATIHAFELNPPTAEKFKARFTASPQVHIHAFGLGDRTCEVEFYAFAGEASELSSLRTPLHQHVPATLCKSQIHRGDEFCRENQIERIAYLKIDAEHADMEVIKGFSTMLQEGRIDCLQWEHQGGRFLKDFYDLLVPMGYSIGKLYANYIDFRDYQEPMEHLLGPNYVALPTRESATIQQMIKGW